MDIDHPIPAIEQLNLSKALGHLKMWWVRKNIVLTQFYFCVFGIFSTHVSSICPGDMLLITMTWWSCNQLFLCFIFRKSLRNESGNRSWPRTRWRNKDSKLLVPRSTTTTTTFSSVPRWWGRGLVRKGWDVAICPWPKGTCIFHSLTFHLRVKQIILQ